jgi:hypothetical protein
VADPLTFAAAVALGSLAGVASGLFGVGGGIILVPASVYLLATPFHEAKAASLLVIALVTVLGIVEHRKQEHVDLRLGVALSLGGVSGSVLAVHLAEGLGEGLLRTLFGVALVAFGVRLWYEVRERTTEAHHRWVVAPLLGFGAGLLAGLFGVGGGVLMVPAMVFLGVGVHTAVGTSLVAVLANSAAGTAAHLGVGYGPSLLELGVPFALGSAVGIHLGARAAGRLAAPRLRRGFGAFLVAVGVAMALTSL